jgi:hypothetical protein
MGAEAVQRGWQAQPTNVGINRKPTLNSVERVSALDPGCVKTPPQGNFGVPPPLGDVEKVAPAPI